MARFKILSRASGREWKRVSGDSVGLLLTPAMTPMLTSGSISPARRATWTAKRLRKATTALTILSEKEGVVGDGEGDGDDVEDEDADVDEDVVDLSDVISGAVVAFVGPFEPPMVSPRIPVRRFSSSIMDKPCLNSRMADRSSPCSASMQMKMRHETRCTCSAFDGSPHASSDWMAMLCCLIAKARSASVRPMLALPTSVVLLMAGMPARGREYRSWWADRDTRACRMQSCDKANCKTWLFQKSSGKKAWNWPIVRSVK